MYPSCLGGREGGREKEKKDGREWGGKERPTEGRMDICGCRFIGSKAGLLKLSTMVIRTE